MIFENIIEFCGLNANTSIIFVDPTLKNLPNQACIFAFSFKCCLLLDEFSVKSDESSACNSESEPRKLRQAAIAEKLGKSRGGSGSDKSAKSEPDGKISKRKTSSDYFERKSLYKPLQKIYSFKSKFTDRKSGGKAQEKLSEKALAPAVLLAAAAEVKSPQVVARKSALVKSSSSSEVAIKVSTVCPGSSGHFYVVTY